jgi:NTE family protein
MIAFVLSGGGSQGALQVGALQALIEQGIQPDLIVGTSVGAVNSVSLAYNSSPDGLANLAQLWGKITTEDVYPGNYATALWRLARGAEGLYPSENLKGFLTDNAPGPIATFGDLATVPLYIVATKIPDGSIHIFGEDPQDNPLDAVMASTALPPFHSPYQVDDQFYVDGSISANLPLQIAVKKGAKTIYAFYICNDLAENTFGHGTLSVMRWSVLKLLTGQVEAEVEWVRRQRDITLHLIHLKPQSMIMSTDFSRADELISEGYRSATTYLAGLPAPATPTSIGQRIHQLRDSIASVPQQVKTLIARWNSPNIERNI